MKNGDVYTFTTFIRFFFKKKIKKKIQQDFIFIESGFGLFDKYTGIIRVFY